MLLDAHVDVLFEGKGSGERRRKFDCVFLLKYSSNIQMIFKSWYAMLCSECFGQPWQMLTGVWVKLFRFYMRSIVWLQLHAHAASSTPPVVSSSESNGNFWSKNRGKFIFDVWAGKQCQKQKHNGVGVQIALDEIKNCCYVNTLANFAMFCSDIHFRVIAPQSLLCVHTFLLPLQH